MKTGQLGHIDRASEEILKVLYQPNLVERGSVRLKVYEDIEIAIPGCRPTGY